LKAIHSITHGQESINLARILFKKAQWKDVAKILKSLEDPPERTRILVMAYARSILLSGGPLAFKAYQVIRTFDYPIYDAGAPGQAVLAGMCFAIVCGK
jgi:hypothetical protein